MYDAIVLAGGKMKMDVGFQSKALVEIAGKPMLFYVLDALLQQERVDRVFVAGPVDPLTALALPDKVKVVPSGERIMDSVKSGVAALGHQRKTILATVDTPLISSLAIADFLQRSEKLQADFYYSVIEKENYERRYPNGLRTYVKLRDGIFTGGNLFLFSPAIVEACMQLANQLVAERKNPFKLAALFGWGFLIKFATGFLSLEDASKRFSKMSGVSGAVIRSPYAELGFDVDRPEDIAIVESYMISKR